MIGIQGPSNIIISLNRKKIYLITTIIWLIMAALWNRAGHYIFAPWILSFFLSFSSSPNLSSWTLDVYHTSTHSVALVRI